LLRLLEQTGRPFPLDRAALLLAVDEHPRLNLAPYLARLDGYALQVEAALPAGRPGEEPRRRLGILRRVLFEEESFHGDRENFFDVRNSYLNEVLDRRLGIPISLAAVMLAVAGRLGWPVAGVSFPGHFLVRYTHGEEILAVDPFHGGLILGPEDLDERWRHATGKAAPTPAAMLEPAAPRDILLRMLENIRVVHRSNGRFDLAALATEKSLLLDPRNPRYSYDLAQFFLGAKDLPSAQRQLERFVEEFPDLPATREARRQLQQLQDSSEEE
jgi:regulator of sirC expression with transglutaminase-like and TPR domain